MLHLSNNCIRAIADCLGGLYRVGDLRATCSHIRSIIPKVPLKFGSAYKFQKYCCKKGDLAALEKYFARIRGVLYLAARYCQNDMLTRMIHDSWDANYFNMVMGAIRSGNVEQFRKVCDTYNKCTGEIFGKKNCPQWLMENIAGRSGQMPMCKEVEKITIQPDLNNFLAGAARGGHVELCEYLISQGASDFKSMVYHAQLKDSVEVFDLAIAHIGFEACENIYLEGKVQARIRELRANRP